ncbi:MAG: phytanoyl-CoA dioxygenase family protein [Sandaracinaceae bacterium]|nr:phytanoyl-CoA dioxygenase family protein [Sandaracinaceae bacterium]
MSSAPTVDVAAAVRQLEEEGYAVLPSLYSEDDVRFFRETLLELYEEIGSPPARADGFVEPAPEVEIGPAGIVFRRLTHRRPNVIPRLFRPEAIEVARGLLGPGMYLELPAGVVSDHTRPFFEWHTHIGGVDDSTFRQKRIYPRFERSHRVTMLHYLDDLRPDNGPLLVLPRKLSDPTEPPYSVSQERWPGQVEINCPRGSVVILEQCIWHAALQKLTPGLRLYVGFYFAAAEAEATPLLDPSLSEYAGDDALFRSVLPRRA